MWSCISVYVDSRGGGASLISKRLLKHKIFDLHTHLFISLDYQTLLIRTFWYINEFIGSFLSKPNHIFYSSLVSVWRGIHFHAHQKQLYCMIMVLPLLHFTFCEGISPYSGGHLRIAVDSLRTAMTNINDKDYGLILVPEVKALKTAAHVFLAFGYEIRGWNYVSDYIPHNWYNPVYRQSFWIFTIMSQNFFIRLCHNCIFGPSYKSTF